MTAIPDPSALVEEPAAEAQRLRTLAGELGDSLHRLASFQKKVLKVKKSADIEGALDQMEALLEGVIEFTFARTLLLDESGVRAVVREMTPAGLEVDESLLEWAWQNQELAIVPVEGQSEGLRSLLLLPLVGSAETLGMLILWLETESNTFTQEQSTLLVMLALETASVIEAHRYRARLQGAQAALSDVVESVPQGLLALDAAGRIQLFNSTLEFMIDVRRADAINRPYAEVLPPMMSTLLGQLLSGSIAEEREITVDIRGEASILGLSVNPLRAAGASGWAVLCRDLKLSREITKLRELDTLKNDFLSLVSHELRTPLTSILAYSETLLMEGMVETEEERRDYLQTIHSEGQRLCRLINDILDLAKMQAGKMEYRLEDADLGEVVRSSMVSSQSLADQKSISLKAELEDLPRMKIDPDRITQVLLNLYSNAIKFTPEGGSITTRARLTPPEENTTTPTVTVEVEDTGIGIAPEHLNRVFSKFEQVERVDHHSAGTGLGTSISKRIIEEGHGGKIWLTSEVGKGTIVFFRIPVG